MFATSLALIGQEFHGKDRATAFGVWGATVGGAVAVGPLVGGVVTESLGWEWIFFVNVPIGIGAMVLTERKIVNVFAKDPEPIDVPGLVTFSLALFLLIFGLIRGNPEGWGSPLILACLIGAGGAAGGVHRDRAPQRATRCSTCRLFRKPAFNGVSAVAFGLSAGMFAMFLYLTIYMQGVLDFSPLEAGLRFLPLTVLGFIVAPISGALSNRIPIRVLLGTGLAVVGVGLLLMHGVSPDSEWTTLLAGFLVAGIGIGITNPGIGQAAIAVVPVEKSGMGSGINTTFRQVGIATGVAGARRGLPVAGRLEARRAAAARAGGLGEIVASGGSRGVAALPLPPALHAKAVHAADVAFVSGFNEIILIAAILSFVGAALGFALVRSRDFVQHAGPDAEPRRLSPHLARRRGRVGPPRVATQSAMLRELRIENLLLIERAELRLGEGLNAITGETGAGKTVLAHSLDLLMGGKAQGRRSSGRAPRRPGSRASSTCPRGCWRSRRWRSWPSGCRRAPRRSCWGGGSRPAGGPAPSSPGAPRPPPT